MAPQTRVAGVVRGVRGDRDGWVLPGALAKRMLRAHTRYANGVAVTPETGAAGAAAADSARRIGGHGWGDRP